MDRPTTILWLRRDLRLHDHPALVAAVDAARTGGGALLPIFIWEPGLYSGARSSGNRTWFVRESLAELRSELQSRGSTLLELRGPALVALPRLVEELLEAHARLGHHRHRPRGQRLQCDLAARGRQRRADHRGDGVAVHDLAQEGQAVHAGHLDVEQQHVRAVLADGRGGQHGVGRAADERDVALVLQQVLDGLADHGRVIDHIDLDGHQGLPSMGRTDTTGAPRPTSQLTLR